MKKEVDSQVLDLLYKRDPIARQVETPPTCIYLERYIFLSLMAHLHGKPFEIKECEIRVFTGDSWEDSFVVKERALRKVEGNHTWLVLTGELAGFMLAQNEQLRRPALAVSTDLPGLASMKFEYQMFRSIKVDEWNQENPEDKLAPFETYSDYREDKSPFINFIHFAFAELGVAYNQIAFERNLEDFYQLLLEEAQATL
jgi:hypothetical protein